MVLGTLSVSDLDQWEVVALVELEEELLRRGQFQPLVPDPDPGRNQTLLSLFEVERYSNLLLHEWIKMKDAVQRTKPA